MDNLLVYGAYGFTGELIAREAVARGGSPVVAGRDRDRIGALASDLGLEGRAFALDATADGGSPASDGDPWPPVDGAGAGSNGLADRIADVDAVLNCAGPFVETAEPLVEACLATGTHYLDITGEFRVFERLAGADDRASERDLTILPGVGFDVVPSDCLAKFLQERLPEATDLALGIAGVASPSRGTARTMVRNLGEGGVVRRRGRLVKVPAAYRTREIDFGRGPITAVTIPWGDVSTAYHSTGIENVEVYVAASPAAVRGMRVADTLGPLLGARPVRAALDRLVSTLVSEPDERELAEGEAVIWGEVTDGAETVTARTTTPNPYALTAEAAVTAAERVLDGESPAGFQTPSTAFGPDFALELAGADRDVLRSTAEAEQ